MTACSLVLLFTVEMSDTAENSEGVLNAKLADFGLHAIVEAVDRNETVRKM